ncbi:alpha/beta hydrolase [Novosphingobium mangrovi (ex Huang et al. 2023)]|uniref:Alpha/beta hydrolase n=1 Tax=Novosphingobium mangrovi (ex Huang et al. 2023) TaxID=2976432 RepID=A0ABT2I9Z8_9SPHN|nr:alpha/beta hydrolase [Novosphingobium mangrovi (ex Huang et al. 2023)]MCT2401648.1 alpha/beta hydrolase [Novosphingobium mangrovi (ex Huang et al. 2023)]
MAASATETAQTKTIAYGTDSLQDLDFTRARGVSGPAPLIVFVHGGGWKRGSKDNATGRYKAAHFTNEGYAFTTINYRLVPDATVEQQAQDVADALAALLARAKDLGIAPGKVVLMGHSAGAHLVALVGTDPQYLHRAGLSYAAIAGVVPIDGAAYDVPRQIVQGGRFMHATYVQAFGEDAARQRALSPTVHAPAPNATAFLLLHVQREDGIAQARELETALRKAGTQVERREFAGRGLRGHAEINRELGNPDYPATAVVDAWLRRILR